MAAVYQIDREACMPLRISDMLDAAEVTAELAKIHAFPAKADVGSATIGEAKVLRGMRAMNDVTRILSRIESGDSAAATELLPLVYEELRQLAAQKLSQESPGNTLQATALVHEAYVRLVDVSSPQLWNGRGHFFAAAAKAMRRILINRARDKTRRPSAWKLASGQRIATGRLRGPGCTSVAKRIPPANK